MPTPPKKKAAPPAISPLIPVSEVAPLIAHQAPVVPSVGSDHPSSSHDTSSRFPPVGEDSNSSRLERDKSPEEKNHYSLWPAPRINEYEEFREVGKADTTPSRAAASLFTSARSLRPARTPLELDIKLSQGADGFKHHIVGKAWLQDADSMIYRTAVKQVLLIASVQVKLEDLRSRKAGGNESFLFKQQLEQLKTGQWPIEVTKKPEGLEKTRANEMVRSAMQEPSECERFTLIKYGARTKCRKQRHFSLVGGQLVVYASKEKGSYPRHYYGLAGAEYVLEEKTFMKQIPPFEAGFDWRIRIACRERQAGPLLLYAESEKQAQGWMRVIKFARYTTSQDTRTSLQFCIRRILSKSRQKGFDALARYVQELLSTKAVIWQFAMRLIKVDHSRAWTKCRAVYKQRAETLKRRRERQTWALLFLVEKVRKWHKDIRKPTSVIREDLVTRTQHLFRLFKNRSLSQQSYLFGSTAKTRPQQGKQGVTMGIAFKSVSGRDALTLMLDQGSLNVMQDFPQTFLTTKDSYTEYSLAPRVCNVHISDCLSMLLVSDAVSPSDVAGLSQADWSQFIHLDRISAIILNSERVESPSWHSRLDVPLLQKGLQKVENVRDALQVQGLDRRLYNGIWFTVLGPRLGWGRQVQQPGDLKQNQSAVIVGVEDGLALGDTLMHGGGTHRFRIFMSVKAAMLPSGQRGGNISEAVVQKSRCLVNLLGRSFSSGTRDTHNNVEVDYSFSLEVAVPMSDDRASSLATLDDDELCLDVVRADGQEVIWRARVKLWRLLAPGLQMLPSQAPRYSLSMSMLDGRVEIARKLVMTPPDGMKLEDGERLAHIDVDVTAEILEPIAAGGRSSIISPELKGMGSVTSLYSSHRGAWYDPYLGPGKFQPDHVANFVEFTLGTLRFPHLDLPDSVKLFSYVVEVRCVGACASSPFLHRPRQNWSKLMDASQIAFRGAKIFLPLPPGFWSGSKRPSAVQLIIYRCAEDNFRTASYTELAAMSKAAKPSPRSLEPVYHASLHFEGLALNAPMSGVPISVGPCSQPPTHVALSTALTTGGSPKESVVLGMEVALRDRDYVLMASGEICSGEAPSPLCVGDTAVLNLEEQLVYPSTPAELKKSLSPAAWDQKEIGKPWGMPLRKPNLVHELNASGLRELKEYEHWRQKNIPRASSPGRIAPYQYILPPCERSFQERRLPGVFCRILDDIAQNGGNCVSSCSAGLVVQRLTHLTSFASCIVLALHSDGTCDLELSPSFLSTWRQNPSTRYAIPGLLHLLDGTDNAVASYRVILQGVPVKYISPAHSIGFNLYDASVADVDRLRPQRHRHEFELASPDGSADGPHCGGYSVTAGPLPADANPSVCTYEWSLQLCAPSEKDVYHFITTLRQCIRLGHQQKARQLMAARRIAEQKSARSCATQNSAVPAAPQEAMGQLEVVLVEARGLERKRSLGGADSLDAVLGGASPTDHFGSLLAQTDLNVFVNFKMLSSVDGEVVPYKGVKTQSSLVIHGSENPKWRDQVGLTTSGGWTFRSSCFNPEKMPDMLLELDVRHQGITAEYPIGAIQLPVARGSYLTNPDAPFRDLWLPLTSEAIDGQRVLNSSGEVRIMTLWKSAADDGNNSSARSYFLSEVNKRLLGASLREPAFDSPANLLGYNPNNLGRHQYPRRCAEEIAFRIEGLLGAVSYIECCEQRQMRTWHAFRQQLKEDGLQNARLGELRLVWQKQSDGEQRIAQLQTLLSQGVPGVFRPLLWPQLTLSSRVQSQYPLNAYQVLLENGRRLQTPAYNQLDEDIMLASEWETSQVTALRDLHHERLEKARNVCIALITFSLDASIENGKVPNYRDAREQGRCIGTAVTYCESLLVLAFHMLLPQSGIGNGRTRSLSEEMVFWLLYTLIATRINGAYKDYYATTGTIGSEAMSDTRSICWKSGAMEDVLLLQCALALHEPDLWIRMAAVGFQPACVFYTAFMHLFVRMLPTSSAFRLWDLLFAESSNPNAFPHARHTLVDLAFGVLRSERNFLVQCQSALEMQSHIESALSSLYDPQAMIDLIDGASTSLWGGFRRSQLLKAWRDGAKEFDMYLSQYDHQNNLLKQLCHLVPRELREEAKAGSSASSSNTSSMNPGLKTSDVCIDILPLFSRIFPKEQASNCGGVLRPVPKSLLEFYPAMFENGVEKVLRFVGGATSTQATALIGGQVFNEFVDPLPKMLIIPCPVGSTPEPQELRDATWVNEVNYNIPGWKRLAKPVFDAFVDPYLGRMSLNEFLIGLICTSKGTAGEKASALFDLFASAKSLSLQAKARLWPHSQHHRISKTKAAHAVVRRLAEDSAHSVAHGLPPNSDPRQDSALHFKIWTTYQQESKLMGEVVIKNLNPFIAGDQHDASVMWFSIWSTQETHIPKLGATSVKPPRTCIGEMEMALKWTPKDAGAPEVGQLWIFLRAIRFFIQEVPGLESKHPWVTVVTYDTNLAEKKIPLQKRTRQKLMSFSSGDHISFPAPSNFAKAFTSECGWHQRSGEWRWNSLLGEQESVDNFAFIRDRVIGSTSTLQAMCIDIWAVRIIVQGVLARSLQYVTNRQAMLLADACFTRTGAVPGLLDAVLVPGESVAEYPSVAALKEDYKKNGKELLDVSLQLVLEAERQACQNVGCLNLWPNWLKSGCTSLQALKIADPWPSQKKSLWLRYVRAASGERDNCVLLFDASGDMMSRNEVRLDADGCDGSTTGFESGHPETTLTKEEFVSCLLACPPLAEPLRRMSAEDHSVVRTPPILLDVTLDSRAHVEEEADLADMLFHARTDVLLEVWMQGAIHNTFLAEAWMPPLERCLDTTRVEEISLQHIAEHGPTDSRPHHRSVKAYQEESCGTLTIEAAYRRQDSGERGSAAPPKGQLSLSVLHLDGLQEKLLIPEGILEQTIASAHIPMRHSTHHEAVLFVTGYAWNEKTKSWVQQGGRDRCLFQTHGAKMIWNNPAEMRGAVVWKEHFEISFGGEDSIAQASRGPLSSMDDRSTTHLKLSFGGQAEWKRMLSTLPMNDLIQIRSQLQEYSWDHQVEVFASDTIAMFLEKLAGASKELGEGTIHRINQRIAQRYLDFSQDAKAKVLMVYAPSTDAAKQHRPWNAAEFKKIYAEAMETFDHWEPLDPTFTFNQYALKFGFCNPPGTFPPLLRVEEAGETLRTKSHSYRRFLQEKHMIASSIEKLNTDRQAFAWARYHHSRDTNSIEWRPCVARSDDAGKRMFKISWAFSPAQEQSIDASGVLLAPSEPEILNSLVPEHQPFLAEAQELRASGMNDQEIASLLNSRLEQTSGQLSATPPPITIGIVRSHLQRVQARQQSEVLRSGEGKSKRMK